MKDLPRTVLIGLLGLTVLRLAIAQMHEVSPDEAYYTMWSERLAPSYYSKGPGVALALKATTTLFGKTPLGVRFLAPVLALATSLLVFKLARALFDHQVATWSVVMLNLTPIFNAGALIMNIDPLSVFFWVAAMAALWAALHRANPRNLWWAATGAIIGLGFLCKYTNALQLLSIVLLFSLKRRYRHQFTRPGIYMVFGVFALCTIPVIVWNTQHGWITVTHLQERGRLDESTGVSISEFLEFLGVHLGVYSPLIFVGLVWALVAGTRDFFRGNAQAFVIAFSLPIVALYFALSWREAGEANWTAPGFIGAGVLLAYYWHGMELRGRWKVFIRNLALWTAASVSLLMMNTDVVRKLKIDRFVMAPVSAAAGLIGKDVSGKWEYRRDPAKRIMGWGETSRSVEGIIRNAATDLGEDVFLIGNKYQTAAILSFHLPDDLGIIRPNPAYPPVHCLENPLPQNQFSFWPRYDGRLFNGEKATGETSPFLGKTALYITDDARREGVPSMITKTFREHEIAAVIDIMRRGEVLRTIKVFACFDYQGLPL